jgi:hypothetical protein
VERGQQEDGGLESLLLPLGQVRGDHLQRDGHADADRDRRGGADPDLAERVLTPLLAQEGGDDPDDQRGFETLPQPDHERGQH